MFDGGDRHNEAARAGLTVDEFREWSELNGTPLCGHVLPHGGVCRQVAGPAQLSPRAWLHLHRAGRCRSHRLVTGAHRLIGAIPRRTNYVIR